MRIFKTFLTLLALSFIACAPAKIIGDAKPFPVGEYQYTGYNKKGDRIVSGRLSITSVETVKIGADQTVQFKGDWQLDKSGEEEKIGPQTGKGDLVGSIIKGELFINLNPNMADNNVNLRGVITGKRFHGSWSYDGYAGAMNQGTFEATMK
jgi:hypothetical protein